MKKSIFILICSIAFFTATSRICLAQDTERKFGIGFNVSYLNYLDESSIEGTILEAKNDIAIGANITYNFTNKYSVELSVDHVSTDLGSNIQRIDPQAPPSNVGDFKQTPILLTGRIHIFSKNRANFYLGAGLGYYFHSFDSNRPVDASFYPDPFILSIGDFDVKNSLGYHIGGSAEINLYDNFSFCIDLKHIWNKADIKGTLIFDPYPNAPWFELGQVIEDNEEIDLDTFAIGVGFKYYF